MRDLCPSKEMRQEAQRISKRKDSCGMCVYCDEKTRVCEYPDDDFHIYYLDIKPCYEGVLKFLVQEAAKESGTDALREVLEELMLESPKNVIQLVIDSCKRMRTLTNWIIGATDNNWQMPPQVLERVRKFNDSLNEAIAPPNNDL